MTCPGGGRPPAAVRWPCSNHSMRPGHGLDPGPRDTWPWLCHHVTRRPQRLSSWVPGHVPRGQSSWWQEAREPPGGPAPDPSPPEGPAAWWEGTVGPHPGQDQAGVRLHTDSGRSWRQRPAVAEVCGDGPGPCPWQRDFLWVFTKISLQLSKPFSRQALRPPLLPPGWGTCLLGGPGAADSWTPAWGGTLLPLPGSARGLTRPEATGGGGPS